MEVAAEKEIDYKKTRIGWIPNDWQLSSISTVFNFLKTNSLSRSQLINSSLDEEAIYNIHYGDIHSSFEYEVLNISNESKLPKVINNKLINPNTDYLKDGDIIMADASEDYQGICDCVELKNINNLKLVSGLHTFALRDAESNFIDGFKPYLFKHPGVIKSIYRVATGTSVLGVSKTNLGKILVPIPSPPEQQKIALILSDWDTAIENTKILTEKLQLRKKGLIQQLLTGKTRLAGFTKEWQEVSLGDVTKRITKKNEELNDTVITISAQRGFVRQEDYFKKRVASSTLSGYYLIENGDFAYNKSYSNGYPMGAFKRLDDLEKAVVTTLYICFSLKENIDSDFLLNYFEGGLIVRNLMKIAQEGGRAHGLLNIGLNDFFSLKLTIPSKEEQKAISNVLNTVDKEIKIHQTQLKQLKTQKKGLMQQLLTGKIRVN
jgi:type I restriction enzyme S subunit